MDSEEFTRFTILMTIVMIFIITLVWLDVNSPAIPVHQHTCNGVTYDQIKTLGI